MSLAVIAALFGEEKAMEIAGPVVIDCRIEQEENVFPMIPSGGTVNDTIDS